MKEVFILWIYDPDDYEGASQIQAISEDEEKLNKEIAFLKNPDRFTPISEDDFLYSPKYKELREDHCDKYDYYIHEMENNTKRWQRYMFSIEKYTLI